MNVIAFPIKPEPLRIRRIGPGTPPHKRRHKTATGAMVSAARKIALALASNPDFDGHDRFLFDAANRWLADHRIAPLQGDNFREALQVRVAMVKHSDHAAYLVIGAIAFAVREIDLQNRALAFHDQLYECDGNYRELMSTNGASSINGYVGLDRVKAATLLIRLARKSGDTTVTKVQPGLVMQAIRDGLRERRFIAKKLASKTAA